MSTEVKLTILADNRSSDPARFPTEHGLSILLDTGSLLILLDTGASDLFVRNARKFGHYPGTTFYTGHCTGDNAFKTLKSVMGDHLKSFRAGMQILL